MSDESLYGPVGALYERLVRSGPAGWSGFALNVAGREGTWSAQVHLFGRDRLGDIYATKLPSWDLSGALRRSYDTVPPLLRDGAIALDDYGAGLGRYLYRE